jgi:hypothetical protein
MDDIITVSVSDSKYTITEMSEVKALFMIPLAPRLNDAWERRMGTTHGNDAWSFTTFYGDLQRGHWLSSIHHRWRVAGYQRVKAQLSAYSQ